MIKYIQNKHIDYLSMSEILETSTCMNQFTNRGPAKALLESKLENLLELPKEKKVICTANGTLALHALFLFFKKRGVKKFASPSFTFPSCSVGGFRTKIVDISLENYSFANVDKIIEENDCLIVTNLFGTYPADLLEIYEKCKQADTKLILDNASSPLTKISNINMCAYGDASFGSLHHTKFLGFGEGGFLVIDKEHEEEINSILGFGFSGYSKKRKGCPMSSNYKISDVSCAAILQHIEGYDISKHIATQDFLMEAVSEFSGVRPFNYSSGVVYGNMALLYDKDIDIEHFRRSGVEAQKYYYPIKEHKNSLHLYKKIVNLPLHSGLRSHELKIIYESIKSSLT